jgi:glyoxylase-like metal-dependent hydrolase (beta-lactamase superfamily II)
VVEAVADGVWRWAARHPEWHPSTEFGAEVACWLAHEDDGTVLVDPLLPAGDEALLEELDGLMQGQVVVAITIPYHVRDAAVAARRWGATVLGHSAAGKRLPGDVPFRSVAPGDELPLGLTVHRIGNPRRQEQPVALRERRALAVGDAIVGVDGGLRVWVERRTAERVTRWYRERLVPSLEPLLTLDVERVLVTHGDPVLADGRAALADALAAPPWYHRPN